MDQDTRIIAVDLGNTRTKFGYFSSLFDPYPKPESCFVDKHKAGAPGDFESLKRWLDGLPDLRKSSVTWYVAWTGGSPWDAWKERLLELRPLDRFESFTWEDVPLTIDVDYPEKVGLDRLLAAAGAYGWVTLPNIRKTFGEESPLIVVDAGSAMTVDLVTEDGVFDGGAIFPGLEAIAESLPKISPRLPKASLFTSLDRSGEREEMHHFLDCGPSHFAVYPGKSTEEAIAAGIYWGAIGAIRQFYNIVRFSCFTADSPCHIPIFLTGGDAKALKIGLSLFMEPELLLLVPDLVLSGIALTAQNSHEF